MYYIYIVGRSRAGSTGDYYFLAGEVVQVQPIDIELDHIQTL